MQIHQAKQKYHRGCPESCDGHRLLEPESVEDGDNEEPKIRALYVQSSKFVAPTSEAVAKDNLDLFPLSYHHISNAHEGSISIYPNNNLAVRREKKERQSFRKLLSLASTSSYDDKTKKILYVEEWVSKDEK